MSMQVTGSQVELARVKRAQRPWYRRDYVDVDLDARWTYVIGLVGGVAIVIALSLFLPVGAMLSRLYLL